MILVINGAFGVGKTTVARLLRRAVPGSMIYDPEVVGWVLRRLPGSMRLRGRGTDDFQDIDLWRKSAAAGVGLLRAMARDPVLVPMAFSRREYFDEIVSKISSRDSVVRVFCLRAGMPTIIERLERRGAIVSGTDGEWILRKAQACVAAHEDPHFGEPIDTERMSALEVAREILNRTGLPYSPLG
ncbi:MAG TPA: AAA family ATPase [Thermoanaerobaculia bacterium]|nr:AAA family ATPase [Thermoanaerobaculia bacterium]